MNCTGHCPSADNPRTVKVETDCHNVTAKNSQYKGAEGNLCQVQLYVLMYVFIYIMYFIYFMCTDIMHYRRCHSLNAAPAAHACCAFFVLFLYLTFP